MTRFTGRTILIVGAGKRDGIGFATALRLAGEGARVALADLAGSEAPILAADLPGDGHSAHVLDVTDESSIAATIGQVVASNGKIDGAVIASGIYVPHSFLDATRADWERSFAINCTGAFLAAQAVAKRMVAQKAGRIVLIASINGKLPTRSAAAYGTAKAAVVHMGRYMALELAPHGVTVNSVCPGSTMTSMMGTDPARHAAAINGSLEQWRLGIPLGHMAKPEDQAAAIAYLLSDDGRHVTGQSLNVDGGQTFF